ncbi:hypothetical protein Chor_001164 [Crotalus horridus]
MPLPYQSANRHIMTILGVQKENMTPEKMKHTHTTTTTTIHTAMNTVKSMETAMNTNSQSLEDRDEITEQQICPNLKQSMSLCMWYNQVALVFLQTLLASSSKSNEDDDNHSDVSKDDDHPDSDESDESQENFTEYPTQAPVTLDSVTHRGDVAPYGFRAKDDQMSLERSGKFDSQDVSDEVDSTPDDESREYAKARSLESHETDDKSNLRDSNEVHSASHDTSLEDHSPEKPESVEDSHDHSKVSISLESTESGEQKKDHSEELQQLDSNPDDVSNQSLESAENHHSTEDHHSVEHHDSVEDNEVIL